jgi:hypothetical protein
MKLICYNNKFTTLPELPNSLKIFWCNSDLLKDKKKHKKQKYLIKIIYI